MHVISQKTLRLFWRKHRDAEQALRRWFKVVRNAHWRSFAAVKAVYASVNQVGEFTVFNIGGNRFRLIAAIHYNRDKIFVRRVLTHVDYDRGGWKGD